MSRADVRDITKLMGDYLISFLHSTVPRPGQPGMRRRTLLSERFDSRLGNVVPSISTTHQLSHPSTPLCICPHIPSINHLIKDKHVRRTSDTLLAARIDDDARILLSGHVRRKGLGDVKDTEKVGIQHRVPVGLEVFQGCLEGEGGTRARDAGVVHQDVHLSFSFPPTIPLSWHAQWEMACTYLIPAWTRTRGSGRMRSTYLPKDLQHLFPQLHHILHFTHVRLEPLHLSHIGDGADSLDGRL